MTKFSHIEFLNSLDGQTEVYPVESSKVLVYDSYRGLCICVSFLFENKEQELEFFKKIEQEENVNHVNIKCDGKFCLMHLLNDSGARIPLAVSEGNFSGGSYKTACLFGYIRNDFFDE